MGLERALLSFPEHQKITSISEDFWFQNGSDNFELVSPPCLVKTVKWKFDYILFRKAYDTA